MSPVTLLTREHRLIDEMLKLINEQLKIMIRSNKVDLAEVKEKYKSGNTEFINDIIEELKKLAEFDSGLVYGIYASVIEKKGRK